MPASSLILVGVMVPTFGIIGSLAWPHLQRRLGLGNLRMVLILVILASLVPAYGCLGFLPVFQRIGFGGLNSPSEIYGLAGYFGTSLHFFPALVRALDRGYGRVRVRRLPSLRSGVLRGADPQRRRG
jgi:UMF1 family MFS transporter